MSREAPRVCIVGAGPAGLAVSASLSRAGIPHDLIDENPRVGGNVDRSSAGPRDSGDRLTSPASFVANTDVIEVRSDKSVILGSDGTLSRQHYDAIFLCCGAYDGAYPRTVPAGARTTTVGSLHALLKGQRLVPEGNVVLAGAGPLLHVAAVDLTKAGVRVAAVADRVRIRDYLQLAPFAILMPRRAVSFWLGIVQLWRHGTRVSFGADVQAVGPASISVGHRDTIAVDVLGVTDYFAPQTQLARTAGCTQVYSRAAAYFFTETDDFGSTNVDGIYVCGEGQGIFGADHATLSGELAADHYLWASGHKPSRSAWRRLRLRYLKAYGRTLARLSQSSVSPMEDAALLCACENVPVLNARAAIRFGLADLTSIKAVTRCGMGRCQGRYCEPSLVRLIADEGQHPQEPFFQKGFVRPVSVQDFLDANL